MNDVLAVLTFKSIETCLKIGGTQSWRLVRANALRCRYVVLCRNGKHPDVEGQEPHLSAFLIGKVSDVVPSTEGDGRWLVKFNEYAVLPNLPNAYPGHRNPITYTSLEAVGVDLRDVAFVPTAAFAEQESLGAGSAEEAAMTIAGAKAGLAKAFGVKPEAIEITIRG